MKCTDYIKKGDTLYLKYHDEEWGRVHHNEHYLYEMFILECFQSGLSWRTILYKRSNFEKAYDNFDIEKILKYDDKKINELLNNKDIIRNKLKINASIKNSKVIKDLIKEYGSFDKYIWHFTNGKSIYVDINITHNDLSDKVSKDLKKRGCSFVGTITIFSYLQAIGVINSHSKTCKVYKELIC